MKYCINAKNAMASDANVQQCWNNIHNWWGSVVVSMLALFNVVNRHWVWLLLGWMTVCGQVKTSGYVTSLLTSMGQYNEYQLLGWVIIWQWWMQFLAVYSRASGSGRLTWSKGQQSLVLFQHSSYEPGEFSQCSEQDDTMTKITVVVIIIFILL